MQTQERHLEELLSYTPSNYLPADYVAPRGIQSQHNSPRYGFPNDISSLIDGSDDVTDYILGVVIGAIIILLVAVVWGFIIAGLRIAGPKRVGFLAGKFVEPGSEWNDGKEGIEVVYDPTGDPSSENHRVSTAVPVVDEATARSFNRRVWLVRGMFVLSGIAVIISGILFYAKGVAAFQSSLNSVRDGIDLTQSAAYKAIDVTDSVIMGSKDVYEKLEVNQSVDSLGSICGLDGEVSVQIESVYRELKTNVDQFKNELEGSLDAFGDDLRSLITFTQDIEDQLDSVKFVFYSLITISVFIIALILCMLVGVLFATYDLSNCLTCCMRNAIIWPCFTVLLLLSWILATLFLILSLGGADFCVAPDSHVQAILNQNADKFDGLIFGFVLYYVSGCSVKPPGAVAITNLVSMANMMVNDAHSLVELVGDMDVERLGQICGITTVQATALESLITLAHGATHVVNRAIVGLGEVLDCGTFNPIYTTFVHDAFCLEGVSGLTYIFTTTLCMAIFSMLMIMFRAALYPVKTVGSNGNSDNSDNNVAVFQGGRSTGED